MKKIFSKVLASVIPEYFGNIDHRLFQILENYLNSIDKKVYKLHVNLIAW